MLTNKTNIANQLVNAGTELDAMENATVEDAFDKINIIVNYSDEHDVFLPLFDRLAMLIDPVTNVVIETNEDDDVEYIYSVEVVVKNFQPTYSMSMRLHIVHIAVVALGTRDKINEHLPPKPTWIIHKGCGGFFCSLSVLNKLVKILIY